tara:strand:- start:117 stop:278 length:162 start_codon:yes stop_codon:yes gene_type:complete
MSSKATGKEEKEDLKILNRIAVLVDPDQTPKPRCTIHHEELVLLCRKLTGIAY